MRRTITCYCLEKIYPWADYITANISSPNTKNLRDLQAEGELDHLLGKLGRRREELSNEHDRYVPLAVKVAPDLEDDAIPVIAEVIGRHRHRMPLLQPIQRSAAKGCKA